MIQKQLTATAVGTNQLVNVGASILGVKVNNPTGMWLYLVELATYIPPSTIGWADNLEQVSNSINFNMVDAPTGGTASVAGGTITIYLYQGSITPSLGQPYTAATATSVAAVTAAVNALAASVATAAGQTAQNTKLDALKTSVDTVAANQAGQATSTKQDTQSTKLDTLATNQATQSTKLDTLATNQASELSKLDTLLVNTQPINNALVNFTVSVNAATIIRTASGKEVVVVYNPSTTATIWLGGSSVTTGNGTPIKPGRTASVAINGISLYGVSDGGAVTVQCMRGTLS